MPEMPLWLGATLVALVIGRIVYNNLINPHGMVVRVVDRCRHCTATSTGSHILCNCGARSPHFFAGQFGARRNWRRAHLKQVGKLK